MIIHWKVAEAADKPLTKPSQRVNCVELRDSSHVQILVQVEPTALAFRLASDSFVIIHNQTALLPITWQDHRVPLVQLQLSPASDDRRTWTKAEPELGKAVGHSERHEVPDGAVRALIVVDNQAAGEFGNEENFHGEVEWIVGELYVGEEWRRVLSETRNGSWKEQLEQDSSWLWSLDLT